MRLAHVRPELLAGSRGDEIAQQRVYLSRGQDAKGRDAERSLAPDDAAGDAQRSKYISGIERTRREHEFGAAVEVKDPAVYKNRKTRVYASEDGLAGASVLENGDLVLVFKHPSSRADINDILRQASQSASKLDAFDTGGFLPNLYRKFGFRPVARVAFADEFAPENWPYERAGRPRWSLWFAILSA